MPPSPPVIVLEQIPDADLEAAARKALIASAPSREAQREWTEQGRTGAWHVETKNAVIAKVVRHPTTGVTWVSAHGNVSEGCDGGNVNVWGLFRVDAKGALTTVQLRALGEIHAIDKLIDLEGDGELELIGHPWLELDLVLTRANGEPLDRLVLSSDAYDSCRSD